MKQITLDQIEKLLKEQEVRFDKKLDKKFEENNEELLKKIKFMIDDSEANIIESVDKAKADTSQVEEIEVRVEKLEQAVFS